MIKKLSLFSTFLLVGFLSLASSAAAEKIDSFDISAEIGRDGTVNVSEYIKYDFEGAERHGIYRDIPLRSEDGPDIAIEVVGVSSDSQNVSYVVLRSSGKLNIKIGDANELVSGVVNYRIDYKIFGSIRFFEQHDEFYWNVTGNDWQVPILSASAKVFADFGFLNTTSSSCYTGPTGSVSRDCGFVIAEDKKSLGFSTIGSLSAGSGLTFSVLFPKGEIDKILADKNYSDNDSISWGSWIFGFFFVAFFIVFFAFFIFAIVMGVIMSRKLYKNKSFRNNPIVVQYGPPEGFSLSEVATIGHRQFRPSDFSAVVIKLAVDGHLKIAYPQGSFLVRNNYELVKLKDGSSISDETEKKVFEYLFVGGNIDSVKIKDLDKKEGSILVDELRREILANLIKRGIFEKSWHVKLSDLGNKILWKIFGFAEFLKATEKDKLKLLNSPELRPEIFEKFLPYAMALGLEKKWAGKFETIVTAPPSWVSGYPVGRVFSVTTFTQSMNSFGSSVASSSIYSSGGGGRGSSGGGSGGGGGGSW